MLISCDKVNQGKNYYEGHYDLPEIFSRIQQMYGGTKALLSTARDLHADGITSLQQASLDSSSYFRPIIGTLLLLFIFTPV